MPELITSDQVIDQHSQVTLHFSLALNASDRDTVNDSDPVIDATPDDQPATFVMGDGSLLPDFERRLLGLRAGEQREFVLPAAEAFGEHQPDNIRQLPAEQFKDMALEPGLLVSFASPEGELPGLVQGVHAGMVTIDFNHPLAGRDIRFNVEIVSVVQVESAV